MPSADQQAAAIRQAINRTVRRLVLSSRLRVFARDPAENQSWDGIDCRFPAFSAGLRSSEGGARSREVREGELSPCPRPLTGDSGKRGGRFLGLGRGIPLTSTRPGGEGFDSWVRRPLPCWLPCGLWRQADTLIVIG